MNEDLRNALEDLSLVIQDMDLSEEAKIAHLNLIEEVLKNPSEANLKALLVVLETTSKLDNLAIKGTIDQLKIATDL